MKIIGLSRVYGIIVLSIMEMVTVFLMIALQ